MFCTSQLLYKHACRLYMTFDVSTARGSWSQRRAYKANLLSLTFPNTRHCYCPGGWKLALVMSLWQGNTKNQQTACHWAYLKQPSYPLENCCASKWDLIYGWLFTLGMPLSMTNTHSPKDFLYSNQLMSSNSTTSGRKLWKPEWGLFCIGQHSIQKRIVRNLWNTND